MKVICEGVIKCVLLMFEEFVNVEEDVGKEKYKMFWGVFG